MMKSAARFTAPAAVLLLALTGCSADQSGGDAPSPTAAQSTTTRAQSTEAPSTTETQSAEPSSSPESASPTGNSEGKVNATGAWNTAEPFISTTQGVGRYRNIFPNGVRVGFVKETPKFIADGFKEAGVKIPTDAQFAYLETSSGEGLDAKIDDFTAYDGEGDYREYKTIQSWFQTAADHAGVTPSTASEENPSMVDRLTSDEAGLEATAGAGSGTARMYFVTDEQNPEWVKWVHIKFLENKVADNPRERTSLNLIPGKQAIVPKSH